MSSIKISVIVACKDESAHDIETTLDSIINQTYTNVEIIIVDGYSSPATQKVLNSYRFHFSIFISEKDFGIFDAMNKGVKNSTGDWIIFMNIGDSFYSTEILESLVNISRGLDEYPDIIYGDAFHMNGVGHRKAPKYINKYTLLVNGICHQSMLIKKSCFSVVGLYDTSHRIGGDPDWNIKAYNHFLKFYYSNKVICNYKGYGQSSDLNLQKEKFRRLKNKYFNRWQKLILFLYDILTRLEYKFLIK